MWNRTQGILPVTPPIILNNNKLVKRKTNEKNIKWKTKENPGQNIQTKYCETLRITDSEEKNDSSNDEPAKVLIGQSWI